MRVARSAQRMSPVMSTSVPLEPGCLYHLYNCGNNRESLFRKERNAQLFLRLLVQHTLPVARTYAYCLMNNHFHALIQVRSESEWCEMRAQAYKVTKAGNVSNAALQAYGNLFNAYTRSINNSSRRIGRLFTESFKRIRVDDDRYRNRLVTYIHLNPQKHRFARDFRTWPWSSYAELVGSCSTWLNRAEVIAWFGDLASFVAAHEVAADAYSRPPELNDPNDDESHESP